MNQLFALTNIAATLALLMIAGVGVAAAGPILQEAIAETTIDNNSTSSLGNPFFVEKGKIIGQRVINVSLQPEIEFTVVANATINGNISATNTGTTVGILQPNGVFRSTGQGFIITQDGEVATYTSQVVGKATKEGDVISVGANFWNTPSTGKLAFLNDMMNIFKLQADRSGNFSAIGWEWK
jgi:hypothetical protein